MTDMKEAAILLVDDSINNLKALGAMLEETGQPLVRAQSGEEALRYLLEREFAVVILDVCMPGMDGFQTAELIRTREQSRLTPLIFLTGIEQDEEKISEGYRLGAVDYLVKPVIAAVLRAKVAVFVELFKNRAELKAAQQQELERKEESVQELQETLDRYRALSSAGLSTSVTHDLSGNGPIRKRAPEEYALLKTSYRKIFEEYLENLVLHKHKPMEEMRFFTQGLGQLCGSPRDLLDIHLEIIQTAVNRSIDLRTRNFYTLEGRLLALEMMGMLVEFYRVGMGSHLDVESEKEE